MEIDDINKYLGLEKYQDNFSLYREVKSILKYGERKDESVFISFVIPTFNRVKTLQETIQSIGVTADYVYEIIVVDNSADLSDDNPTYVYISGTNRSDILLYVNERNIGQTGNWNRGFELASGKYIAFLHDDDLLHPDYMTEIYKCIHVAEQQRGNLGLLAVSWQEFMDGDSIPVLENRKRGGIRQYTEWHSLFITGIGPGACPTCGTVFLKEAVIKVGGFDNRYYPSFDYVLGYLILINGYNVYYTEDRLGYYRKGINEAKNNLKGFCKADYCFRKYLYSRNIIAHLWGKLFSNIQYYDSLCCLYEYSKSQGLNLSIADIACDENYSASPFKRRLFELFRRTIQFAMKRVFHV